jgi:hypothetical protein
LGFFSIITAHKRQVSSVSSCVLSTTGTNSVALHRSLASLGASITLLSLAMDPFFQQLVSTPERPSMIGRSSVARSVRFVTKEPYEYHNNTKETIPDALTMNAIEPYFYSNGTISEVEPFCPSTDCAWPSFQTLGVCSACQDVTELLGFACREEVGDWRDDANDGHNETSNRGMACGYFLNATGDNPVLMTGYALLPNSSVPEKALLAHQVRLLDFVDPLWGGSIHFKNTKDVMFDWIVASVPDERSVYSNKTPTATECVLHWCVKTLSAAYRNGEYSEEVVSVYVNNSGHSILDSWESIVTDGELAHLNYTQDIIITPPNQNTTFSATNIAHLQAWINLKQYVPSHLTQENETAIPQLEFWTPSVGDDIAVKPMPIDQSPWTPSNNISLHIENMAAAMTQVMRQYPNSTQPAPGSGSLETYIKIQWGWFSFPLLILILTLAFLIAVIWKGQNRSDIGIWKTSSLAALANGLDENTKKEMGSTWKARDIFEKASEIEVSLISGNGGCKLTTSNT